MILHIQATNPQSGAQVPITDFIKTLTGLGFNITVLEVNTKE